MLDLHAWARDALALAVPSNLLCREDCAGLCPVCGANLNEAGPDHHHEPEPDPRWAAAVGVALRIGVGGGDRGWAPATVA